MGGGKLIGVEIAIFLEKKITQGILHMVPAEKP